MFTILDDEQKEELCSKIETLFAEPSPVDGSCGMFTMSEPLIKERAAHFNSCLMSVYSTIHDDANSIGMFEIVSSLDEHFDLGFLVKNVLSEEVLHLIAEQLVDFMKVRYKGSDMDFSGSMIPDNIRETIVALFKEA